MVLAQHGVPRWAFTWLRLHESPIAQSLTSGKRMDKATELAIVRRTYAKQVLAEAQVEDPRIEAAFATVPREDFLGTGPWSIPRWLIGPVHTPTPDPIYLYSDKVVQIVPERHLNNGLPSAHAKWIAAARPVDGEHVVHIGTGTGYYTAILAHLVGPAGSVTGIEIDPGLAARAQANLYSHPNVRVIHGDGVLTPFAAADIVYVSAGATRPPDVWLDGLSEGGQLVLPLTTNDGFISADPDAPPDRLGAMFLFERQSPDVLAQWISPAAFIPCASARDLQSEAALAEAFKKGGWDKVTRFYRGDTAPNELCWLRARDWCLAYQ